MEPCLRAALVLALCLGCAGPAAADIAFVDASATHLPTDGHWRNTMDAAAIDLDGDGDIDLVTPQEWMRNRVLINQGDGRFTHAADLLPDAPAAELEGRQPGRAGKDSEDVSVADFNGDGRLDIVIVVEDDVRLGRRNVHQYFLATADGYERVYGQIPDSVANAVAHGDVDGDGDLDLLIAGEGQMLLINDGLGGFSDETRTRLPQASAIAQDAQFFDADGDGDLDLVLGLEGGHALWINDGAGVFRDETGRLPWVRNVEARKVRAADVDGDGDLDLYFAHVEWGRDPQDRLFINDGTGRFSDGTDAWIGREVLTSTDVQFADFDGDGDLDMVQANMGSIRILRNDGDRFSDVTDTALQTNYNALNMALAVADFDGDGRVDIFVGQMGQPNLASHDRLLLNRSP